MPQTKTISEIQSEIKKIKEEMDTRSVVQQEISKLKQTITDPNQQSIPRKTAAAEAHNHVITGRNMGVVGIGGIILTIMVQTVHPIAGLITALSCIGVLGYMTAMRSKVAKYLETKYGFESRPIFNQQQKQGGFTI